MAGRRLILVQLFITVYMLCTPYISRGQFTRHVTPDFREGLPYSQFIEKVSNEQTRRSLSLWKQAFLDVNKTTEEYFEKTIFFNSACYDEGTESGFDYVSIFFIYKVEWFTQKMSTTIPTIFPSSYQMAIYRENIINFGVPLPDEDILKVLRMAGIADGNHIKVKIITDSFKYKTKDDAVLKLKELLGETKEKRVVFYKEGTYIDENEPVIFAKTILSGGKNRCRHAKLGLVTGESDVQDGACYVIQYDK